MDILISFLTSTETPFFFLFVALFVYFIRGSQTRDKVCNDTLKKLEENQREMLLILHDKERRRKPNELK
jgi:hypothetical protein